MRAYTEEKTVYTFDELTEEAKETARAWYRDGALDYAWWDCVYEDAERVAEILGIAIHRKTKNTPEIYFTGFYCQGSGSSFSGSYQYAKGAPKKIREYAPQDTTLHTIADQLQALQKRFFYRLTAEVRPYRDSSIRMETDYAGTDGRRLVEADQDLTDLMNDFNAWIFNQLEKEYEWLNADEQVDESIRCNEYEFTEEGDIA